MMKAGEKKGWGREGGGLGTCTGVGLRWLAVCLL